MRMGTQQQQVHKSLLILKNGRTHGAPYCGDGYAPLRCGVGVGVGGRLYGNWDTITMILKAPNSRRQNLRLQNIKHKMFGSSNSMLRIHRQKDKQCSSW